METKKLYIYRIFHYQDKIPFTPVVLNFLSIITPQSPKLDCKPRKEIIRKKCLTLFSRINKVIF